MIPNRASDSHEGEFVRVTDGLLFEVFWANAGDWGEGPGASDNLPGWYIAQPNVEEGHTVGPFPTSGEARDQAASWPFT